MSVIPFRRPGTKPPPSAELSDVALLAACAVGEREALGILFDRHQGLVHRYLARSTVRGTDVEDLVQATFIEVWRSAKRFRNQSAVPTFILSIAHNVGRHQIRGEVRRRSMLERLSLEAPKPPATPAELTELKLTTEHAEAALRSLTPNLREAVVLCVLEELPHAEAAKILGARIGTIGRWVHEGRAALRRAVSEDDHER